MITECQRPYEAKGLPLIELDNFARVVMATNDTWTIPGGHDERRFLVLEVNSAHQKVSAYFGVIDRQMRSVGNSALLHMLLNWDLPDFGVRNVPQVNALANQKLKSLNPLETWWHDCLDEGSITRNTRDEWRTWHDCKWRFLRVDFKVCCLWPLSCYGLVAFSWLLSRCSILDEHRKR